MQYRYLVKCWVRPQSGFDLARKNKIMNLFKSFLSEAFSERESIDKAVEEFEKEHDGMVIEPLVIETDSAITDAEVQILPEIQKAYPDAVLLSVERIKDKIPSEPR
jgi:hypothetical protein